MTPGDIEITDDYYRLPGRKFDRAATSGRVLERLLTNVGKPLNRKELQQFSGWEDPAQFNQFLRDLAKNTKDYGIKREGYRATATVTFYKKEREEA